MIRNAFWGMALIAAFAVGLTGCSSSDSNSGGTGGSAGTAGSGGSAGDGGSGGMGGSAGSAGAAGAAGSAGSAGDGGAGGMMEETIHRCTPSMAEDLTGEAAVTITDISQWRVPHQACIRISAGTVVTWEGNFTAHPLDGGISPMTDESSPITEEGADSGTGSASVTFDEEGTYPYFCGVHINTMQGVIYVVP